MKRPLVWVGSAYIVGVILGKLGVKTWALLALLMTLAGICGVYQNRQALTNRQKMEKVNISLILVLSVFLLAGNVRFYQASKDRLAGFAENETVTFTGQIRQVKESALGEVSYFCDGLIGEVRLGILLSKVQLVNSREGGPGDGDKDTDTVLYEGDKISCTGRLTAFEKAMDPWLFDASSFYQAQGIHGKMEECPVTLIQSGPVIRKGLGILKNRLKAIYESCFDEEQAGLVCGMVLGDKSGLSEETKTEFRNLGISHILAVSGLHLSVIGSSLFSLLGAAGLMPQNAALGAAFAVLCFGFLSGGSFGTMRAVIAFEMKMGGVIFGRSPDALTSMAFSALILFFKYPLMLFQASAQYTYGAVMGLQLVWAITSEGMKTRKKKERLKGIDRQKGDPKRQISESLLDKAGPCLCVSWIMLPLIAWYNGTIPAYSSLVNILVVPVMSLVLPFSLILGLLSLAGASGWFMLLQMIPVIMIRGLLNMSDAICSLLSGLPFGMLYCGRPPLACILLFYGVTGLVLILQYEENERYAVIGRSRHPEEQWQEKTIAWNRLMKQPGKQNAKQRAIPLMSRLIRRLCRLRAFLPLAMAVSFLLLFAGRWQSLILFADVGQGDCALIRSPSGTTYMIDGGSSSVGRVGEKRLAPMLDHYGISRVDYVFVSHGDEDHYSGIAELVQMGRVGHLVLSGAEEDGALVNKILSAGDTLRAEDMVTDKTTEQDPAGSAGEIPVYYISAGSVIRDGSWQFQCLLPVQSEDLFEKRQNDEGDRNERSMVLKLTTGQETILFMGDLPSEEELKIEAEDVKDVNVIKIGHHGSDTSTSEELLNLTEAETAIISCGKNNRYGHPHKTVTDRLQERNIRIRRTDEEGSIRLR